MPTASDIYGSSEFLSADDLQGRAVPVTIAGDEVQQFRDGSEKLVLSFVGKEAKLPLNKTNFLQIAALTNKQNSDDWVGERITLYPTTTEFNGKSVGCIRIRACKAESKPAAAAADPAAAEDEDDIPF